MKIGWCVPLEKAILAKDVGLDFVEIPLAPLGLESSEAFAAAKQGISNCPLPTEAFNVFMPRDLRMVGPSVDANRAKSYLGRAGELLGRANAKVVVYGSAWARNVPDGFDRKRGEDQFVTSLEWSADALKGTGTTLVIEPLNRTESNIVNSVDEGVHFAKLVNRPEVRVLADFYHLDEEDEPLETLTRNSNWLHHIHLADTGRLNPGTGAYPYERFSACLKAGGYKGHVSVECGANAGGDMQSSLAFLRRHWPT